mgnify:CR=1 FL=1
MNQGRHRSTILTQIQLHFQIYFNHIQLTIETNKGPIKYADDDVFQLETINFSVFFN